MSNNIKVKGTVPITDPKLRQWLMAAAEHNTEQIEQLHKAVAVQAGSELEKLILAKAAQRLKDRPESETFDLFPFYSILVSTGTNKNTDHFDPVELWRARKSPIDKPVNIGHKQTRIIGHMLDTIVVGEDLQPIPDDTSESDLPDKLHIIASAVIYKVWEDPAVQAEISTLIDKVAKGDIFVSMECLFRDFAYLLTSASGEQSLIERTPQTVQLTKFLRQYKGPGKIHDKTIARYLKSITFSAVGIVEQPANPDSIISSSLDIFDAQACESVYIKIGSEKMEKIMSQEADKTEAAKKDENPSANLPVPVEDHPQYQDLKSKHEQLESQHNHLKNNHENLLKDHSRLMTDHAHLTSRVNDLNQKLDDIHRKTLAAEVSAPCDPQNPPKEAAMADTDNDSEMAEASAKITSLEGTIADLQTKLAAAEAKLSETESAKASVAAENDAMKATIEAFQKASRHTQRAEAMMAADQSLSREDAVRLVASYDELSDTAFAGMVEMLKGYASRAPKEVTAETILNGAKAEADVPMGVKPEDGINKTSADIKNWFTKSKATDKKGS